MGECTDYNTEKAVDYDKFRRSFQKFNCIL